MINRPVKEWIEKTTSKTLNGRVDGIDNYSKERGRSRSFRRRSAARKKRQNGWGGALSKRKRRGKKTDTRFSTHQVDARPLDRAARYLQKQMSRKAELLQFRVRKSAVERGLWGPRGRSIAVVVVLVVTGAGISRCRRLCLLLVTVSTATVPSVAAISTAHPLLGVPRVVPCRPVEIALARGRALVARGRGREHWIEETVFDARLMRSFLARSRSLALIPEPPALAEESKQCNPFPAARI